MDPAISNISHDADKLRFTLSGVNHSLANALRRAILNDIPTLAIDPEDSDKSTCIFHTNTSRLHNEILKHRLSCIPIHMEDLDVLPGNYVLDVDITNETDAMYIVTTEDFRIKNKINNNYLTREEVKKIYPTSNKTNMYIDFARLRPKIGNTIPGEKIKFTADFSVKTAGENNMYNVVSTCSYGNTVDMVKVNSVWEETENKIRSEGATDTELDIQKKNFYLLDAHRHYKQDSFDFVIQSVGVYTNEIIVKKACEALQNMLIELIAVIDKDNLIIKTSENTIDNCYDIVLENHDYTIGKVLEYILYEKHYVGDDATKLSFCGFKKIHPHDTDSILQVAFVKPTDKDLIKTMIHNTCMTANAIFVAIHKKF